MKRYAYTWINSILWCLKSILYVLFMYTLLYYVSGSRVISPERTDPASLFSCDKFIWGSWTFCTKAIHGNLLFSVVYSSHWMRKFVASESEGYTCTVESDLLRPIFMDCPDFRVWLGCNFIDMVSVHWNICM